MAIQFAAQTVLGAAKTVLLSGKHPAILRDEVIIAAKWNISTISRRNHVVLFRIHSGMLARWLNDLRCT